MEIRNFGISPVAIAAIGSQLCGAKLFFEMAVQYFLTRLSILTLTEFWILSTVGLGRTPCGLIRHWTVSVDWQPPLGASFSAVYSLKWVFSIHKTHAVEGPFSKKSMTVKMISPAHMWVGTVISPGGRFPRTTRAVVSEHFCHCNNNNEHRLTGSCNQTKWNTAIVKLHDTRIAHASVKSTNLFT